MTQRIGIVLPYPFHPSCHQLAEGLQLRQRTAVQLQVEDHGLLDDGPQADVVQVGRSSNLAHRRVADATRRVVYDAPQGLLVVGVGNDAEIGYHVLDLLALVERQAAVDAIRDAVLAHLLLERAALRVGTVQDGEVGVFRTLLTADAPDVVTHNHGLLLVAVGWLQCQPLTLLVLAEHVLVYLPFVLPYQTVGSLYYELR